MIEGFDITHFLPKSMVDEYRQQIAGGPYPCNGFGKECGVDVELPEKLCEACQALQRNEESRQHYLQSVESTRCRMFDSVPTDLQWAALNAAELGARITGGAKMIRKAKAAVEALMTNKAPRIVLQGPAGSGKSVLAVAIYRHLLWTLPIKQTKRDLYRDCTASVFVDAPELGWIRQDSPLGEEPERLDEIRKAPFLVLDDVGGEAPVGPTGLAVVGEMIRARHRAGYPTIYTTGFGIDELTRMYGSGVVRRIYDRAILIGWEW